MSKDAVKRQEIECVEFSQLRPTQKMCLGLSVTTRFNTTTSVFGGIKQGEGGEEDGSSFHLGPLFFFFFFF